MLTRRIWLGGAMQYAFACPVKPEERIAFRQLSSSAVRFAADLGLNESNWDATLDRHSKALSDRIAKGSAEHVTYYVLQSRSFTDVPPIDPVRLAASKPSQMPPEVEARFAGFLSTSPERDTRYRIVRNLYRTIEDQWPPQACFEHTMRFLASQAEARPAGQQELDAVYHRRGFSTDTSAAHTLVLERAYAYFGRPVTGPVLLAGAGLDLTRREGFSDNLPLRCHQADWLRSHAELECADIRPEVIAFLKQEGFCAFRADITQDVPGRARYGAIFATNILLYFDDQLLLLAMAAMAAALRPEGFLVHNDMRFAANAFGEALGIPVAHFEPVRLSARKGVSQMDRLVVHRKAA